MSEQCRLSGQLSSSRKLKSPAITKAALLQSKLDPEIPSFIKSLASSHVSGGFFLRLPVPFCQKYLPQDDTLMTLQSRNGDCYEAKYLSRDSALSGGWKRFALSERLLAGDVLVFLLVSPTNFKVFIIRLNDLTEVDEAVHNLNLEGPIKQSGSGMLHMHMDSVERNRRINHNTPRGNLRNLRSHENSEKKTCETNARGAGIFQTENDKVPNVDGFTSFENFSIMIDESLKDFKLPESVKRSYYELCGSQMTLLHTDLLEKTDHIMIAGLIIETVRIADGLRNCQLSTSLDVYNSWDKTLDALELHGMSVGFLRARLHCLRTIAHDQEVVSCRLKYSKMCLENAQAAEQIRRLQAKLNEMTSASKKLEAQVETLKSKIESQELEFKEQASALW